MFSGESLTVIKQQASISSNICNHFVVTATQYFAVSFKSNLLVPSLTTSYKVWLSIINNCCSLFKLETSNNEVNTRGRTVYVNGGFRKSGEALLPRRKRFHSGEVIVERSLLFHCCIATRKLTELIKRVAELRVKTVHFFTSIWCRQSSFTFTLLTNETRWSFIPRWKPFRECR